jgi:hypothetical protein
MSQVTADRWPRTARVLTDIARSYERDADDNDKRAERDADRF